MKKPIQLIGLPEFARRTGSSYNSLHAAFAKGDLRTDFINNQRQALFHDWPENTAWPGIREKNGPWRLLGLPLLAFRLGLPYSVLYASYIDGTLLPEYVSDKQAMFEDSPKSIAGALGFLHCRLSGKQFVDAIAHVTGAPVEAVAEFVGEQIHSLVELASVTMPERVRAQFAAVESQQGASGVEAS